MTFFKKRFLTKLFRLYPLGDWHYGSRQCDEKFIAKVIDRVKHDPDGYWVGMGDLMENAIVGSKSDVYTQTTPPREQMDHIVDILTPIRDKGLFLIGGNHEARTMRVAGIQPEIYIAARMGLPYLGFSAYALFLLAAAHCGGRSFTAYFHHNYGGGYSNGGKVNAAEKLRLIAPTADATFSGHMHCTSRVPVAWYEVGKECANRHVGYDYITGSALTWNESYAEEKAKKPAAVEHICVAFIGGSNGSNPEGHGKRQEYEVITP